MNEFPRKRYAVSGLLVRVALTAVILRAPLRAADVPLQAIVTPSTIILKDGRPVTFAVYGFIEFKSLAELFPYIESQTRRWKLNGSSGDGLRQHLLRELLRRGIESRVVSMVDERPLEALVTHTNEELRQALAREGASATRLLRGVSGSAGEMEAFSELLECFTVNSRTGALQLVPD